MPTKKALPDNQATRLCTIGEEILNSVSHGIGIGLSLAAAVLLIVMAARTGDGWKLGSVIVYATTLVLLFTASTLYHGLLQSKAKRVFKILDHAGIYLLIAGTYTPLLLVTLRADGYTWLLCLVWFMALVGVGAEAFWTSRPRWVSVVIYLFMGWSVVGVIRPLKAHLNQAGMWLLALGGIIYSAGCVFYLLKRVRHMHALWHFFVIGGATCHFAAIAWFVI